jgi:hypothetical protein
MMSAYASENATFQTKLKNLNLSAVLTTAITAFPTPIRTTEDSRSSAPDGAQRSHQGTNHHPNHTSKTQIPKPEILRALFLPFDDSIRRVIEESDAPRDMLDEVVTQVNRSLQSDDSLLRASRGETNGWPRHSHVADVEAPI